MESGEHLVVFSRAHKKPTSRGANMVNSIAGQNSGRPTAAFKRPLTLMAPVQPRPPAPVIKKPRTHPSPLENTNQYRLPKKKLSFYQDEDNNEDEMTPVVLYDRERANKQQITMTRLLPPPQQHHHHGHGHGYGRRHHWQSSNNYRYNNNSYMSRHYPIPSLPMGVKNIGNTCYLSAVLQILSNLAGFFHGELQHAVSTLNLPSNGIASILLKCTSALQSSAAGNAISPADLKKVLEQRAKLFEGYLQQDAHEALCHLLDGLQEEVLLAERRQLGYGAAISANATLDPCTKVFSLAVERTVTCVHCGEESCATEQYSHLSLELPHDNNNNKKLDIDQLLSAFFMKEMVDKTCEKCKSEMAPHTVTRKIVRAPRVLVLHLKRFNPVIAADGTFECIDKVSTPVHIPDELNLDNSTVCSGHVKPPLSLHAGTMSSSLAATSTGMEKKSIPPPVNTVPPLTSPSPSPSLELEANNNKDSKSAPVSPCVLPRYDQSNNKMVTSTTPFPSRLTFTSGMVMTPTSATAAPGVGRVNGPFDDEEAAIQRALEASLKPQATLDDLATVSIEEGLYEDDLKAAIAASLAQVQDAEKIGEQPPQKGKEEELEKQEQQPPSSPRFASIALPDAATPTFNRVPGIEDYTTITTTTTINNDGNGGMQQQVPDVSDQCKKPSVVDRKVEEDASPQYDADIAFIVEEEDNEGEKIKTGDDTLKSNYTYKLQSIINHEGFQATSGHFTADIKDEKTAMWHHYNDSYVSPLSSHAVHGYQKQKECFIIFYTINM